MSAVIDLHDHKTISRQVINVCRVAFCGPVGFRRDIAVVEHDRLEPAWRGVRRRDGQQAIDLVSFREIADDVLVVVEGRVKLLLECDRTAGDLQLTQVLDGDLPADFEGWRSCRWSRRCCACWCVGAGRNACAARAYGG